MAQPQRRIAHPNQPTIIATVEKPNRVARMRLNDTLNQKRVPVPVWIKEPDAEGKGGIPLIENGEQRIIWRIPTMEEFTVGTLKTYLKNVEGLVDDNGKPIAFDFDRDALILYDEQYDVTEEGKPVISFSGYLSNQYDGGKLFDPDPTPGASTSL